jgi:hypothetical protein
MYGIILNDYDVAVPIPYNFYFRVFSQRICAKFLTVGNDSDHLFALCGARKGDS